MCGWVRDDNWLVLKLMLVLQSVTRNPSVLVPHLVLHMPLATDYFVVDGILGILSELSHS